MHQEILNDFSYESLINHIEQIYKKYEYNEKYAETFKVLELQDDDERSYKIKLLSPFDTSVEGIVFIRKVRNTVRRKLTYYDRQIGRSININYARYLYQTYLWKIYNFIIPDWLDVDHINNNSMDDRIINYQLLTRSQNSKKYLATSFVTNAVLVCPVCENIFVRKIMLTHLNRKSMGAATCCSLSCRKLFNTSQLDIEHINWIRMHQVMYIIKAHYFNYEDYFHDFYPHSAIIKKWSFDMYNQGSEWKIVSQKIKNKITMINNIVKLADTGISHTDIAKMLDTKQAYVSYVIRLKCPEFSKNGIRDHRIHMIRDLLTKGYRICDIASHMDLSYRTVSKFVHKYLKTEYLKLRKQELPCLEN